MRYLFYFLAISILSFGLGCGGGGGEGDSSSPTGNGGAASAPPAPTPTTTLRLQSMLARTTVAANIDQFRLTGFDGSGQILYGPVTATKGVVVDFPTVPITVTRVQIEFLQSGRLIGIATANVVLAAGQVFVLSGVDYIEVIADIRSITIEPDPLSIERASSQTLSVMVEYQDGGRLDITPSAVWSVVGPNASITPSGTVTGEEFGEATVTARFGALTANLVVHVVPRPRAIEFFAPRLSEGVPEQWADFNGDHLTDVLVRTTRNAATISEKRMMLGQPDFSFTQRGTLPDSRNSVVGDFDGDGTLDLVLHPVAGPPNGRVTVGLNDGSGLFNFTTGPQVGGFIKSAGHFDSDGFLDLFTPEANSVGVDVSRGDGAGGLAASIRFFGDATRSNITFPDLDANGFLDILFFGTAASLSSGNGTFGPLLPSPRLFGWINSQQAVDFNEDGLPDLALIDRTDVAAALGDGMGGFQITSRRQESTSDHDITAPLPGDLNDDHHVDILRANGTTLDIFFGDGTGQLAEPAQGLLIGHPEALFDYENDGLIDLLVVVNPARVGQQPTQFGIQPGRGDGTLYPEAAFFSQRPNHHQVGRLDGDRHPDIVTITSEPGRATVHRGDGQGHLLRVPDLTWPSAAEPRTSAVADLNGDALGDIVVGEADGAVRVFLNQGGLGFQAGQVLTGGELVVLADLDTDRIVDLIAVNATTGEARTFLGAGDGTFTTGATQTLGGAVRKFILRDVTGDGLPDLIAALTGTDKVAVFLGLGDGSFAAGPNTPLMAAFNQSDLAVMDLDGDTLLDLAVTSFNVPGLVLFRGDGAGGFTRLSPQSYPGGFRSLVTGDLDGDGREELLASKSSWDELTVLDNFDPNTGFLADIVHFAVPTAFEMDLADFNSDGVDDLTGWGFGQTVWVIQSR